VSELIYDRQSVGQSVLVSGAHLGPVTNFSFATKFLFRHLRFCKLVAPSLTRGRVCKLLYTCFWVLASWIVHLYRRRMARARGKSNIECVTELPTHSKVHHFYRRMWRLLCVVWEILHFECTAACISFRCITGLLHHNILSQKLEQSCQMLGVHTHPQKECRSLIQTDAKRDSKCNLIVGFCILLRVYPLMFFLKPPYVTMFYRNIVAYGGFKKNIRH
jgi:hypothetical protein